MAKREQRVKSGTVDVVDGATNLVVATLPVGDTPTAVAVDSVTGNAFVANAGWDTGTSNVSVIGSRPPPAGAFSPIDSRASPTAE